MASELSNITSLMSQPENQGLITLTQGQLWNLIQAIATNLTASKRFTGKPNMLHTVTITETPLDFGSNVTNTTADGSVRWKDFDVVIYVSIFFLWYTGVIFVCLIGLGVYKKKGKDMYKSFVDRSDIKEELKKQKQRERNERRMRRLNSVQSFYSSPSEYGCSPDNSYNHFALNGVLRQVATENTLHEIPAAHSSDENDEDDELELFKPLDNGHRTGNGTVKFEV